MSVTHTLHDELARRRAAGDSFDQAWPHAARAALLSACDEGEWQTVLVITRPCWERAYDRAPAPRHELAAGLLNQRSEGVPLPDGRRCIECDQALPPTAHANRKVCAGCLGARRLRQNLEYNRARREPIAA